MDIVSNGAGAGQVFGVSAGHGKRDLTSPEHGAILGEYGRELCECRGVDAVADFFERDHGGEPQQRRECGDAVTPKVKANGLVPKGKKRACLSHSEVGTPDWQAMIKKSRGRHPSPVKGQVAVRIQVSEGGRRCHPEQMVVGAAGAGAKGHGEKQFDEGAKRHTPRSSEPGTGRVWCGGSVAASLRHQLDRVPTRLCLPLLPTVAVTRSDRASY